MVLHAVLQRLVQPTQRRIAVSRAFFSVVEPLRGSQLPITILMPRGGGLQTRHAQLLQQLPIHRLQLRGVVDACVTPCVTLSVVGLFHRHVAVMMGAAAMGEVALLVDLTVLAVLIFPIHLGEANAPLSTHSYDVHRHKPFLAAQHLCHVALKATGSLVTLILF